MMINNWWWINIIYGNGFDIKSNQKKLEIKMKKINKNKDKILLFIDE